ncbi:hypothetical protein F6V30_14375 [Oryzomonas sagensis]|uniref:Uncharacterized protein n=1 Tax=Oryzomonas sagensis TaxID=2603857 RepID=A0ABQ6TL83_9BACT|nr:hypothetical protein [Oryzomonas sagensis]KAB0669019.1 hypothetical protein F6V30_14375 [Oryzomonas sagensis]
MKTTIFAILLAIAISSAAFAGFTVPVSDQSFGIYKEKSEEYQTGKTKIGNMHQSIKSSESGYNITIDYKYDDGRQTQENFNTDKSLALKSFDIYIKSNALIYFGGTIKGNILNVREEITEEKGKRSLEDNLQITDKLYPLSAIALYLLMHEGVPEKEFQISVLNSDNSTYFMSQTTIRPTRIAVLSANISGYDIGYSLRNAMCTQLYCDFHIEVDKNGNTIKIIKNGLIFEAEKP